MRGGQGIFMAEASKFLELPVTAQRRRGAQLTVFIHFHGQAFFEAAGLALVPAGHVDRTAALLFAHVLEVAAHASLEEAAAAVTGQHSVMLARCSISAHQAERVQLLARV